MYRSALALFMSIAICACTTAGSVHTFGSANVAAPLPPTAVARADVDVDVDVDVHVEVSFFGVPLAGAEDVVFVLDRSGSMGGVSAGFSGGDVGMSRTQSTLASIGGSIANSAAGAPLPSKLEAAQDELIRTLELLPDGTRFGVIFFDRKIQALSSRMMVLSPPTRAGAAAFIRSIEPGGSTAAVPAMNAAYQMGARRIVLLSDGLANTGGRADSLLADARRWAAAGGRIDTVGLGLDQDDNTLRVMASQSGGMAVVR